MGEMFLLLKRTNLEFFPLHISRGNFLSLENYLSKQEEVIRLLLATIYSLQLCLNRKKNQSKLKAKRFD